MASNISRITRAFCGATILLVALFVLGGTYTTVVNADGPAPVPTLSPAKAAEVAAIHRCDEAAAAKNSRVSQGSWLWYIQSCLSSKGYNLSNDEIAATFSGDTPGDLQRYCLATDLTIGEDGEKMKICVEARHVQLQPLTTEQKVVLDVCVQTALEHYSGDDAWRFAQSCVVDQLKRLPPGAQVPIPANRVTAELQAKGPLPTVTPSAKPAVAATAAPAAPAAPPKPEAAKDENGGNLALSLISGIFSLLKWLVLGFVALIGWLIGLLGWLSVLVAALIGVAIWAIVKSITTVSNNGGIFFRRTSESTIFFATPGEQGDWRGMADTVKALSAGAGNNRPSQPALPRRATRGPYDVDGEFREVPRLGPGNVGVSRPDDEEPFG